MRGGWRLKALLLPPGVIEAELRRAPALPRRFALRGQASPRPLLASHWQAPKGSVPLLQARENIVHGVWIGDNF